MIINELKIFFAALMFYTRIPCPAWVGYDPEMLNKATRYFTLIGLIVGSAAALVFWGAIHVFPTEIAIVLSMATTILLTGAFHEDGFSDTCDGFGGGYTKESILNIMKDSRIGNYGAIGIILILLFKFFIINSLPIDKIVFILIASHALSRLAPVLLIYRLEYSRDDELSKAKPIGKKIKLGELILAIAFAAWTPFIISPQGWITFLVIIAIQYFAGKYFVKKIGGYTGDCLGATQQISEIALYTTFYLIYE